MAYNASKKVTFDLRSDSQQSGPIIEIDTITDITIRTTGLTPSNEVPQSALKVKPRYPYNPSKQKFDIRVDPEIRKRHGMVCSYEECE